MDPPTCFAEDYDAIVQGLSVNRSSASANATVLDTTYAEYSPLPLGEPDFATYYPFGDHSVNPFDYIGGANSKTPYLELGDWSTSAPTGPAINNDLGFDIADSLRDNVYPPAVSESTTDIYNESNTFSPSDVGSSIPSVNPIDIQQILFPTASEFNALDMSPVGVNRETQALPSHQPLVNPRAIDALIGMTPGKLDKRTLKMIIRDTCHTLVNAHPEEHVTFDSGGRKHRYTSFTLPQHSGEDTDNQELYSPDFTKTAKHDSNRPFIKAVVKAVCEVQAPSTCGQLRSIVMAKTEAYFRQMMRNFAKQNSRIRSGNKENLQA